ncbi:NAD(P)-binding protein [Agromyces sp. SYSU K20354]|uniref:NAD(P)-binding protein n=1 Tax=Agromyces cavernae TaxID=2898659 RepID=UPI001E33EA0F|nr:NAD(P)-binding protein [Agromyces cavernae]MCD2443820.1 NAD(P)-binding protein [Agromyces cavernae]
MVRRVEVDYLVVGAGAAGMVFTDQLLAHTDATVAIVDRRHAPGGHWIDAYPFVRMHQPALSYGVASLPFGVERRDTVGVNAGLYELASAAEVCAHFDEAMTTVFLPTDRVRYFPMCEHVGGGRFTSLVDGEEWEAVARRRIVDATYVEGAIPATTPPSFAVDDGVRCVPAGELARLAAPADRFTVIGAGKTALDTCVWLLEQGVDAAAITWIKPREGWWPNRRFFQPYDLLPDQYVANADQTEVFDQASSTGDVFARLDELEILLRVDRNAPAEMFHGAIVSDAEVALLRRIENVVRLGRVRAIGRERIQLDEGSISTTPGTLHVHCTARGLARRPLRPIFEPGRITVQPMFWGTVSMQYALLGVVEALLPDDAARNALCPPINLWDRNRDFLVAYLALMVASRARVAYPDVAQWARTTRLYPFADLPRHADDPRVTEARARARSHAAGAFENLTRLVAS